MKKCLFCNNVYPSDEPSCQTCGSRPAILDGFPAYAPDFVRDGGGFKASYFADLARLEEGHFWFCARNRLIIWALEKYCPRFQSFLEIGCGTGYVLSGIAKAHPESQLLGSELFTAGLAFAAVRQPEIDFMQMDARHVPYVDEFDAVGAFDVLEHIEEDEQVLTQIHNALKPGGILLLTVPQHSWLWGPLDEYACHVRRYSAPELHSKAKAVGFEILRSTSFVSSLLPAMLASRMLQKTVPVKDIDATAELRISPWLNWLFKTVLTLEILIIQCGINFPLGGSRLIVARKI